jgi:transketolase
MNDIVDMRDAFFNQLYSYVAMDKNVIVLTADHGAFGLKRIEQDYPSQYLNVGIAEQAMIGIAAGLAKCGKKVYIYAINNFVSLRVLEQVNIDICAMNLDVNIIGVGAGFTYSTDGPTHHGTQDLSAMLNLPNLEVYNVTDDINTSKLVDVSYRKNTPKYFRIEKGKLPRVYSKEDKIDLGYKLLENGNVDVIIISTGYMTNIVCDVVTKMKDDGLSLHHVDIFRVSPLPVDLILEITNNKHVITVEENNKSGGIGERIISLLKENDHKGKVLNISLENSFYFNFGSRESLHKVAKIDKVSILEKINNFIEQRSENV